MAILVVAGNLVLVNRGACGAHQRREGGKALFRDMNPRHLRRDGSDFSFASRTRRRHQFLGVVGHPSFPEQLVVREQLDLALMPLDLDPSTFLPGVVGYSECAKMWEQGRADQDEREALLDVEKLGAFPVDDGMLRQCMLEGDPSPDEPMEEPFLPLEFRIGDFDYAMIPVNAAA